MRKVAIALSKGGVGKSTTAVNLAAALAQRQRRILLIDMDTQGQLARMLNIAPTHTVADVVSGEAPLKDAIIEARPGVDLLAGGRGLAGLKRAIDRKEFGGEQTLSEALAALDARYDYVIVDTAPGWDVLTVNALFFVEEVLTPVALEVLALQGLQEFMRSLAAIRRYHPRLTLRYILPTFFDRRVRKSDEILQQLRQHFPAQLCHPIRYNVRLSEAPGYGQTIFEYAVTSTGAEDYRLLAERVLNDEHTQTDA
ncbi:ParA family protein [Caldilinea sp.]|uniref:ParA family protein n=1 Tax=Caldilinea sp. TaxID=2293560 RepID=UPI0021DEEAB1|nr:ParA family protein [Caldilinea sp.]GIV68599.1 MAG: chromosome partitioning protein ParA [Caldilinea sp.]